MNACCLLTQYYVNISLSTLEQGDELSSGVGELFTEQISHLSPSHLDFFVKWYGLVALEEAHSKAKDSTPLWLTDPLERCVLCLVCTVSKFYAVLHLSN